MKYSNIVHAFFDHPWAILPEKLTAISELIILRAKGGKLTDEEIEARTGGKARTGRPKAVRGSIAVLPVHGTISQRIGMMEEASGGVGADELGAEFDSLINDPNVGAVVFDISSPGGSVYGVGELAAKVHAARGTKPIIAVANSLAASAAYWLASAADEIVVTPGGQVGSIGVFMEHLDVSGYEDNIGMKTTLISAGKYKVEGHPYGPLDDEARAALQKSVDEYYDMFVSAVAKNRGASKSDVRNGYGEGRVVGAKEAVDVGLADRVATFEQVLNDLAARQSAQKAKGNAALAALSIAEAELN